VLPRRSNRSRLGARSIRSGTFLRLARAVTAWIPPRYRPWRGWRSFSALSDARSFRRYRKLKHLYALQMELGPRVALRMRALGDRVVHVRPGTSDVLVIHDTLIGSYHLPPSDLRDPRTILDLGSNIGLTLAHFAALYPTARILGVELDAGNHALAVRNVRSWEDRVTVIHGAAWVDEGEIQYGGSVGSEFGFRLTVDEDNAVPIRRSAPAYTLDALTRRLAGDGRIDYVKMDVEGAEAALLTQNTGWARRIDSIKVEVHPPFTIGECRDALERLGFEAWRDDRHWATVVGVRRDASTDGGD
jgi:FkbM family methyltransferase